MLSTTTVPFSIVAFVAKHAHRDGSQLLEDVPLEGQWRSPLGLVEGVELEFVSIETRRHRKVAVGYPDSRLAP